MPEYLKENVLDRNGLPYEETASLEDAMPQLDILYMTRVQKERFFNEADYIRLKDTYVLDPEKLVPAKSDLAILHPLPRVNEITVSVDKDPPGLLLETGEKRQVHSDGPDYEAAGCPV